MSAEQNKDIYRRFIQEVFNEGRLERAAAYAGADYVVQESVPGTPAGVEGIRHSVAMFRAGFPDLHIALDTLIAEGEWIAARSTLRGTHKGTIMGIAPTGNAIAVTSLTMVRIVDAKLRESWVKTDMAALMTQLGVSR